VQTVSELSTTHIVVPVGETSVAELEHTCCDGFSHIEPPWLRLVGFETTNRLLGNSEQQVTNNE
jgi:hypothetical protein